MPPPQVPATQLLLACFSPNSVYQPYLLAKLLAIGPVKMDAIVTGGGTMTQQE